MFSKLHPVFMQWSVHKLGAICKSDLLCFLYHIKQQIKRSCLFAPYFVLFCLGFFFSFLEGSRGPGWGSKGGGYYSCCL